MTSFMKVEYLDWDFRTTEHLCRRKCIRELPRKTQGSRMFFPRQTSKYIRFRAVLANVCRIAASCLISTKGAHAANQSISPFGPFNWLAICHRRGVTWRRFARILVREVEKVGVKAGVLSSLRPFPVEMLHPPKRLETAKAAI